MSQLIDTKAKRDRLVKRREPYWHKLVLGGYIGYRVGAIGGSWIARYRSEEGKQNYKSLELPAHKPVNEYDTATTEARKWFDNQDQGFRAKAGTIKEATDNYLGYLEQKKGKASVKDANSRIKLHILPTLSDTPLDKLKLQQVRKWFHSFIVDGSDEQIRKSKATANRNLTVLKAILNLAHKEGFVFTDRAWKGVEKFKHIDGARQDFLTATQIKALFENTSGHFKHLLKAGALTGARYGELCKLTVKSLDKNSGLLNMPNGKTGTRTFPLTASTKAFFVDMAKSKLPEAPLLTRNGVDPWSHGDQTKLMRAVVTKAELPASVVFYTLRHSFIADLIDKNMNVFDIAKITGTSIEMIEKHYGKFFKDRVIEVLEKSELA
jgi:integrase